MMPDRILAYVAQYPPREWPVREIEGAFGKSCLTNLASSAPASAAPTRLKPRRSSRCYARNGNRPFLSGSMSSVGRPKSVARSLSIRVSWRYSNATLRPVDWRLVSMARWGRPAAARREGRTLLYLDTREGDTSNDVYRALGWVEAGRIPKWARSASGTLDGTVFYYKELD